MDSNTIHTLINILSFLVSISAIIYTRTKDNKSELDALKADLAAFKTKVAVLEERSINEQKLFSRLEDKIDEMDKLL